MTSAFRNVAVIINPASGNNEPMLNIINDVFAEYDIKWQALVTHGAGDATELARQAAESGYDLIAGYGGDGTLMEVVNGLMGKDIPIAILPGGTGNTVAADLGIPPKLADALRMVATSSNRRRLDVGEINGRYFLLRAYTGIGDDHNASREMKDRLGILAYPISGLRFLKEHPPAKFRITVDGQLIEETGIMCYVNNVAYSRSPKLQDWVERSFLDVKVHTGDGPESAGEPLLQTIDPTDGLLDIILLSQDPFTLQALKSFVVRSGDAQAAVHFRQGKRVRIEADPPQGLWIDGEECGTTPADIQIVPAAVEVVVP
jgi:diacylglycerol kinase family enzyme